MSDNNESSIDQYTMINEVRFTAKEIDILSCITCGRSPKFIAELLGISKRTVESHIRNIKSKIDCSSKEQILSFVERSDKHILIGKNYAILMLNSEFEKTLEKIAENTETHESITVNINSNCNRTIVSKHLSICGIDANFTEESSVIIDSTDEYCYAILDIIGKAYSKNQHIKKIIDEFKKLHNKGINENKITKKTPLYKKASWISLFSAIIIISGVLLYATNHETQILKMNFPVINEKILLDRSKLFSKIDEILDFQKGLKVVMLTGPGGAGKTTIAREYARAQKTNIVWEINAETEDSFVNSLNEFAEELANTDEKRTELSYIRAISDSKEKNKKLILFIADRLRNSGSWCIVLDNVDDFKTTKDFFPNDYRIAGNGKIIITTRNENMKDTWCIKDSWTIRVPDLSFTEQVSLFSSIMDTKETSEIEEFMKTIPPYPLDVSVAAYYLKNTKSSIASYVKLTGAPGSQSEELEEAQTEFIKEDIGYDKTRNAIIASTFDDIIKQNPEFKELLLFICLVDSQNISTSYLKKCKSSVTVDMFIRNLKKHSLITLNRGKFSIHRSTQEIGLKYIVGKLTNNEKGQYLDEVVKAMTPFEDMCWLNYKTDATGHNFSLLVDIIPHLKTVYDKIQSFDIPWDKYKSRILIALGHAYFASADRVKFAVEYYQKALAIKDIKNYINQYDFAVMLSQLGYSFMFLGEIDKAISNTLESHAIVKDLANNEALIAFNCIRIATSYLRIQKVEEYEKFIHEALNIVEDRNEIWAKSIKSQVYYVMCSYFLEKYITKPESEKVLDYAMKILEIHSDVNKSIESMINPPEEFPIFISFARDRIAKYYNTIGDFKSSLLYGSIKNKQMEKIYDEKKMPLGNRLDVLVEESHSLLWLKKNKEAEANLSYVFDTFMKIGVKSRAIRAVFYLIQARINLGKLEQAYSNCLDALSHKYESGNLYTLKCNTCYYHMAVIKYRQKDYKLSLKHFSDFFRSMDEFCKGFLDKDVYEKLVSEKAFEIISDPAQISICFDNALKIFTAIYGQDHAFVKDYAAKKGKPDSWFSLFINQIMPLSLQK